MNLHNLIDDTRTDKNTIHSYIPLYEKLLTKKKETAKNILEIGIYHGGSIKLWSDFFTNATIYGIDIIPMRSIWDEIKYKNNIILYSETDAYDNNIVYRGFISNNIKFDFILDDGPHTLESMITFIKLYSELLYDDGILIIEDIQSLDWIDKLKNTVAEDLKKYIKVYNLIQIKDRYDDIVFTIDKSLFKY